MEIVVGDYLIQEKVTILYLNEIGYLLTAIEPGYLEDLSDLDLVKNFLEIIAENPTVMDFVNQECPINERGRRRRI
jgi:hypothetical protein